jgi:hypothetical protein
MRMVVSVQFAIEYVESQASNDRISLRLSLQLNWCSPFQAADAQHSESKLRHRRTDVKNGDEEDEDDKKEPEDKKSALYPQTIKEPHNIMRPNFSPHLTHETILAIRENPFYAATSRLSAASCFERYSIRDFIVILNEDGRGGDRVH